MTNVKTQDSARSIAGFPRTLFPIAGFTTFDMLASYGAQALVTYYIYFAVSDGGLELPAAQTIAIVSAWTAMSLLSTTFTSWLIDRILGSGKGLILGALVSLVGYLALAFVPGQFGLGIGLVSLTLSSALTLVCEGTLTSGVMSREPRKREAGFTVYYFSSALGAFVGITVAGFTQQAWGFQLGFLASAVFIILGLLLYIPFRRSVESASQPPTSAERPRGLALVLPITAAVIVLAALTVTVSLGVNPALVIAACTGAYVVIMFARYFTSPNFTKEEGTYPLILDTHDPVTSWRSENNQDANEHLHRRVPPPRGRTLRIHTRHHVSGHRE